MGGIRFTGIDVHRANIASQFTELGQGGRWLKALSSRMKLMAASEAPKRSFELARSHFVTFQPGANQYQARATVENRADHASYVHEGTPRGAKTRTPGYIRGNPWLALPAWGEYGATVRRSVSGQAANPWLDRACSQVSKSVGAVEIM